MNRQLKLHAMVGSEVQENKQSGCHLTPFSILNLIIVKKHKLSLTRTITCHTIKLDVRCLLTRHNRELSENLKLSQQP